MLLNNGYGVKDKVFLVMTQEDKNLLLKDLSARLTFGVKAYVKNWAKLDRKYYEGVYTVESTHPSLSIVLACSDKFSVEVLVGYDDYVIKPYLFPLSSMTEEQQKELKNEVCPDGTGYFNEESLICPVNHMGDSIPFKFMSKIIDWLNKNMFDYHNLIEKGLAIEAPEGMYN